MVEMLDLKHEYKNVLANLGEVPRTKDRVEHLFKLIKSKKLAWWQADEPDIHEVLGIERNKRRRMKLIMAKLEGRMKKHVNRKVAKAAISVKVDKRAASLTKVDGDKLLWVNPLAKYAKFKKYQHLDRPKHIATTYEQAEALENERTLAELQAIVIGSLKRRAT